MRLRLLTAILITLFLSVGMNAQVIVRQKNTVTKTAKKSTTTKKKQTTTKSNPKSNSTGGKRSTSTVKKYTTSKPQSSTKSSSSNVNTHEYVDLGLPSGILWATCNIGANSPLDQGDFFAWGETSSRKDYFDWDTYKWCDGDGDEQLKYCTDEEYGDVDNKTELDLSDDAARAKWGSHWRIPTYDDFEELYEKCVWEWTQVEGYYGMLGKSKFNGNYIFFPASGCRIDNLYYNVGEAGSYWTSTIDEYYPDDACGVYMDYDGIEDFTCNRCNGRTIRAVYDRKR